MAQSSRTPRAVTASAPGRITLSLRVGPRAADGYHPVASVFQAVGLTDYVTVAPADDWSVHYDGPFATDRLPADETDLAMRAARLLAGRFARVRRPCRIEVEKNIPAEAGLGSGPADAAATLVACAQLWGLELSRSELHGLAAELGADVPFALAGGTALGTNRGDRLTTLLCRGTYTWVLVLSDARLPTPSVYRRLDDLPDSRRIRDPETSPDLLQALASGDATHLAGELVNDLDLPARRMVPHVTDVHRAGLEAGALGSVLTGSGPTVALLARDAAHALELSVMLSATPDVTAVLRTTGPSPGTRVMRR